MRILLAALVLFAVVVLIRRARRALGEPRPPRVVDAKTRQCTLCGVYFPTSESVVRDGRAYCSEAHAREGADR